LSDLKPRPSTGGSSKGVAIALRLRRPSAGAALRAWGRTLARQVAAEVVNELDGAKENASHAEASATADTNTLFHMLG